MCGYLCWGINEWQEAGKPISHTNTPSVVELKNKLEKGEVLLLDVREPSEWKEEGFVEGARRIFFADLPEKVNSLPKDQPIAVTCSVGNRASVAVSILERAGFTSVSNVLGGMTAWTKLGYPIKK
jgi:hydroxyacylglutathione hydrolase